MVQLTAEIGGFAAELRFRDLPPEMLQAVNDAFTDTIGTIMAGIEQPIAGILRQALVEPSGRPDARACLSSHRVAGPDAALIGGAVAHALDFGCQALSGHPGGVLVPAILAEAETLGSTGEEIVTAFVAGYEAWGEVWWRNSQYHRAGWHPTSVLGPIGAAAACASLRKLSPEKARMAIAIAASHSGGLFSNLGSMTKGYHSGMASRAGVVAARLADAGMTGGADALENMQGHLTAFASGGTPDRDSPVRLGKRWYLINHPLQYKMHPSCFFMHRSFEGTMRMLEGRKLDPDQVEKVDVEMGRGQAVVLVHKQPKNLYQAQFSESFSIAAAVILGKFGVPEIADEVVQRPDMQAFYPKVNVTAVDASDPRDPVFSPSEEVTITLKNGEVLKSGPISDIPGYAATPLTTEELWNKFRGCTERTHDDAGARVLFDLLQRTEKLASAADLPTCTTIF